MWNRSFAFRICITSICLRNSVSLFYELWLCDSVTLTLALTLMVCLMVYIHLILTSVVSFSLIRHSGFCVCIHLLYTISNAEEIDWRTYHQIYLTLLTLEHHRGAAIRSKIIENKCFHRHSIYRMSRVFFCLFALMPMCTHIYTFISWIYVCSIGFAPFVHRLGLDFFHKYALLFFIMFSYKFITFVLSHAPMIKIP